MATNYYPPVLFLDVDGPLNTTEGEFNRVSHEVTLRRKDIHGGLPTVFTVQLSPAVGHRLAAFHAEGLVELRWLTTWMADANLLAEPLGLPSQLAVAGQYDHARPPTSDDWKLTAVYDMVADEARPFIWVDDQAIAALHVTGQLFSVTSLLVVPCVPGGLSAYQLDEIEAFARKMKTAHRNKISGDESVAP